ncbi:hypothetical protein, partial [Pontibacter silvestris]|uniref:hypothetical protein n=1 Tax=Pontibacter silvestris TaxID=2305183 RepID=UPI001E5DBB09
VAQQPEERIKLASITPSVNTEMDFSPWLNDDKNDLVKYVNDAYKAQYIDVTLKLEKKALISKVSLYDHQGQCTSTPAYVYALNGEVKTLIGTFTGEKYLTFVDITLEAPIAAEAIIIHKYGNSIPQKVQVFG